MRKPLQQLQAFVTVPTAGFALAILLTDAREACGQPAAVNPCIRWTRDATETNKVFVEVSGLSGATLEALQELKWENPRWQRLLSVYAEQGDLRADIGLPPMLGFYRVRPDVLRFEPQFPLEPGVNYRAILHREHLPGGAGAGAALVTSTFQVPRRALIPTTVVSQVYPSAGVLPENLLKFYVHFSAPMSSGHIYDHIRLIGDSTGKEVELPFLEIDEELWDPTMTRLTLFIDPGRIKRGVRPLEEIGPALEMGKRYTLVIDRAWHDATGTELKETFRKAFSVGSPDRDPPDPARWKIESPKPNTRDPLRITFTEPLDHALAQRVIQVASGSGQLVEGKPALEDQERRWTFVPTSPWRRGPHKLVIQTTIEDLAGNNIGKPFEVDLFEGVQRRLATATVKLPFDVR
jgi:Big-like domain-containing protein